MAKVTIPAAEESCELKLHEVHRNRFSDLISLAAHLRAGEPVQARRIESILTGPERSRLQLLVHGVILTEHVPHKVSEWLKAYLCQLKIADALQRDADRSKRKKTFLGPELFRRAEDAYEEGLVILEPITKDHPATLFYLKPTPKYWNAAWRYAPCRDYMPRLCAYSESSFKRVYERSGTDASALLVARQLDTFAGRELERWDRLNEMIERLDGEVPITYAPVTVDSAVHSVRRIPNRRGRALPFTFQKFA
jgi:hypothetical protein